MVCCRSLGDDRSGFGYGTLGDGGGLLTMWWTGKKDKNKNNTGILRSAQDDDLVTSHARCLILFALLHTYVVHLLWLLWEEESDLESHAPGGCAWRVDGVAVEVC
jgi:hypothetical protein